MPPEPDPTREADLRDLRARLLRWYARARRDLPWRRTRDAYRIWVSEIMLQQTRVETAIPYYRRFLARFPDVRSLARAPLQDVLAAWSGLGYYRRARLLHSAAGDVVREHGGSFPRDPEAARALPGIGRSTAGAIVSISYGAREPVLDGNVRRVLVRIGALRGDPDSRPLAAALWKRARRLVDCERPGDVNQALMELGATVCLPSAAARCDACPVRRACAARAAGLVAQLPQRSRGATLVAQTWAVALAERAGRVLVRRRVAAGLLQGMFELPTCELSAADALVPARRRAALAAFLREQLGLGARVGPELLVDRHAISNRIVSERVHAVSVSGRPRAPARFLDPRRVEALPITAATRRILARLAAGSAPRDGGARVTRAEAGGAPPGRPRPRAARCGR